MPESESEFEDATVDDADAQNREDIAESLAQLSEESDTPTGFDQSATPFAADDVDFGSDAWMACVGSVQGWLRLDDELPLDDPHAFITSLAGSLGFVGSDEGADRSGPSPKLTSVALDRLRERAERARRLQRLFAEEFLSDGGTRDSATRAWANAWEEDDEIEDLTSSEPVSAKADTFRINEFLGQAESGKLNLTPSYQRGDVWGTGARQLLIESVLRGIPLPSIILLKPSDGGAQEVVDGKQRLTSILRFVGKHPLALDKVREVDLQHPDVGLLALFNEDYPKFKRAWKGLFNQPLTSSLEEQYYFPFKLRTDNRGLSSEELEPLRGKYYSQIKGNVIRVADDRATVKEVFEGHSDYKVPVILYSRASTRQIHEVFNLYNKQGTHLNAEEIRNAIFHDLQITRATLVAAGDSDPRTPVSDIAPALAPSWPEISTLQDTLTAYGFGELRYRRTKILSWIIATLLVENSGAVLPSTAKHIDALLQRVQIDRQDALRSEATIRLLFEWIAQSAEAHSGFAEAWAPQFKDGSNGAKWQELQLVGSLVGVAIALIALGAGPLDDRLSGVSSSLYEASGTWKRPEKTQTSTQWEYISRIARGIVEILGVNPDDAAAIIKQRFGSSGVGSLWSASSD